jgi:crotonobetainyl-CoA:carnitine CoA-transferase CaiB-like acyl-CoA transferase
VTAEPLIGHEVLGAAPPRAVPTGRRPLDGVRVLDLTRVIAGPVCTRYLGVLGADVLRLDAPEHADLAPGRPADTLMAKRSAVLDLATDVGASVLHDLLDGADVVVCGYRPGSLDRFGLGADELARRHPGVVAVYLAAWGHTGPWSTRRGFDSVVQAPTGLADGESADGESADGVTPGALPCQLLDHGTGYLAAAAAIDGLRRQREQGGTHVRRLSLARTAAWITSAGPAPVTAEDQPTDALEPRVTHFGTGDDRISVVDPPGSLGGRALEWTSPPSRYRSDPPEWVG